MRELTVSEIQDVSGAGPGEGFGAFGLALGLGSVTFGSKFGMMAVGVDFGTAPLTVIAVVGLSLYAGYASMAGMSKK